MDNIQFNNEQEEISKIIQQEEDEIKELKLKLKLKGLPNEKITRMKVVKVKPERKPDARDKVEKNEILKKCKICEEMKPLDEFVINYHYTSKKGETQSIKFKNKCLNCYRIKSNEYYKEHKIKVLECIKIKYEKNSKKKYNVKLNFNTIEEMQKSFDDAKEQFLKGELIEVTRKSKKKSGDGGGNGSPSSPLINSN